MRTASHNQLSLHNRVYTVAQNVKTIGVLFILSHVLSVVVTKVSEKLYKFSNMMFKVSETSCKHQFIFSLEIHVSSEWSQAAKHILTIKIKFHLPNPLYGVSRKYLFRRLFDNMFTITKNYVRSKSLSERNCAMAVVRPISQRSINKSIYHWRCRLELVLAAHGGHLLFDTCTTSLWHFQATHVFA